MIKVLYETHRYVLVWPFMRKKGVLNVMINELMKNYKIKQAFLKFYLENNNVFINLINQNKKIIEYEFIF